MRGTELGRILKNAEQKARTELSDIEVTLSDLKLEIVTQEAELTELYQQYARVRLGIIGGEGFSGDITLHGKRALQRLKERSNHLHILARQREKTLREIKEQTALLDLQLNEVNEKRTALENKQPEIVAALDRDETFQLLYNTATRALGKSENARLKVSASSSERDIKGSAYLEDPLFNYLWHRYGSNGINRLHHTGLVALLDTWVARLCNYPQAARNYELLQKLPQYLAGRAADLSRAADIAVSQSDAHRHEVERQMEYPPVLDQFNRAEEKHKEINSALNELQLSLDTYDNLLTEASSAQDDLYHQLIDDYSTGLRALGIETLHHQAINTEEDTDDRLVADIVKSTAKVCALEEQFKLVEKSRQKQLIAHQRAQKAYSSFKSKGYESSRYRFSDSTMDTLITGYLLGSISDDVFSSGISSDACYVSPPSTSSSYSGGSSGFSSGGGFSGGGGFSTGGGF